MIVKKMILRNNKICYHPPCLNYISSDEKYCLNHQDKNKIFKIFI